MRQASSHSATWSSEISALYQPILGSVIIGLMCTFGVPGVSAAQTEGEPPQVGLGAEPSGRHLPSRTRKVRTLLEQALAELDEEPVDELRPWAQLLFGHLGSTQSVGFTNKSSLIQPLSPAEAGSDQDSFEVESQYRYDLSLGYAEKPIFRDLRQTLPGSLSFLNRSLAHLDSWKLDLSVGKGQVRDDKLAPNGVDIERKLTTETTYEAKLTYKLEVKSLLPSDGRLGRLFYK